MLKFSALFPFTLKLKSENAQVLKNADIDQNQKFSSKDFELKGVLNFKTIEANTDLSHMPSLAEMNNQDLEFIESSTINGEKQLKNWFVDCYATDIPNTSANTLKTLYMSMNEGESVMLYNKSIPNHLAHTWFAQFDLVIKSKHSALPPLFIVHCNLSQSITIQPFAPFISQISNPVLTMDIPDQLQGALLNVEKVGDLIENAKLELYRQALLILSIKHSPLNIEIKNIDGATYIFSPIHNIQIKNPQLYGFQITKDQPNWNEEYLFKSDTGEWVALRLIKSIMQNNNKADFIITKDLKELSDFLVTPILKQAIINKCA